MKRIIIAAGIFALGACADATSPTLNSSGRLKTSATMTTSIAAGTVVVSPANMNGWYFWNDKDDSFTGSPGELVAGPSPAPLGTGSVRLGPLTDAGATGAGSSTIATDAYAGTALSQISSLSYSTYQSGPTLAIALQFDVRYRTTDVAYGGRLIFEPYQTVGTVGSGWQTWSPLAGKWWASKTSAAGSNGMCAHGTPCTWSQILTAFPDAVIAGRFLMKAGSNWNGFDGNADALSIGVSSATTVYDFEGSFGACNVSVSGTTITLLSDCTTDRTLPIPEGFTLDGNGKTITAVDPAGGHFLGAIVRNGGTSASVTNLTLTASNLADVCDPSDPVDTRLRGILLDDASGSITNNNVHGVRQGLSGCQEGNSIEVRNFASTTNRAATISGNVVSDYQKTGIVANGTVTATILGNTVTGDGPITYTAQNGIQVAYGATATVKGNTSSGNDYTPASYQACGLLIYQANGVKASSNNLFNNEKNQCNYGKGGGAVKPSN